VQNYHIALCTPHLLSLAVLGDTEDVGEYCTCGVKLPPDARFCHKCGKPQYDEPLFNVAAEEPAQTEPQPDAVSPPLPKAPGINFHNSVAVRVGFFAAGVMTLLLAFPIPSFLAAVWQLVLLLAGGFFSVYLYARRTGESLSVRGGARMGWITGVFCFVIMTVFFTISIIQISSKDGLAAFFREMVSQRGTPDLINQFNEVLSSQAGIATLLLGMLVVFFVMLTLLPAVGGALGAKVLQKEH
jgi:hypothetical protein